MRVTVELVMLRRALVGEELDPNILNVGQSVNIRRSDGIA